MMQLTGNNEIYFPAFTGASIEKGRFKTMFKSKLRCSVAALLSIPALALAQTTHPKTGCNTLQGQTVPASAIGLPTTGATVVAAELIPASETHVLNNRAVMAIGEYCKVTGYISPADPAAPHINFQVNLPADWNRKTIQLGGSGGNGVIPGALNDSPQFGPESQPPNSPYALSRGFITYGSDSGHQSGPPQGRGGRGASGATGAPPAQGQGGRGAGAPAGPPAQNASWQDNKEALENFGYAQMKKTHDVMLSLVNKYYGQTVRHSYYMGSSQGGREALMVAQRYPQDYDGVFSQVPGTSYATLMMEPLLRTKVQAGDGWLPPSKVQTIADEVLRQCDELDGIKDGQVSDYVACNNKFDPTVTKEPLAHIRCPEGKDTGDTCLSDAQIKAVNAMHGPTHYPFPIANGWTDWPGWPTGSEAIGGFPVFRTKPDETSSGPGRGGLIGSFLSPPPFTFQSNLEDYKAKYQELTTYLDATNPDLSAFQKRGGKLLMKANTTDYTANSRMAYAYFDKVVQTMGKANTDSFLRLYVAVGLFHNRNLGQNPITKKPVPGFVDFISMLDDWVETGKAPDDRQVIVDMEAVPPFAVHSSLPLCRYPTYPRYKGAGAPEEAANYVCSAP